MAKSFTLTFPKSRLAHVLPDFDVMGGNPAWVKSKTKLTLENWLSSVEAAAMIGQLKEVADDGESVRLMLSVGGAHELMLRTIVAQTGLSESEISRRIIGLLAASAVHHPIATDVPSEAANFVSIVGMAGYTEVRPEQISFYLQNKASLQGGKIGLSEASTGTGKTVSMLVAAAELALSSNARVAITVPTIALAHQFKSAYVSARNGATHSLKDAIETILGAAPELRSIFGRREFVSQKSLQDLIDSATLDAESSMAAAKWLANAVDVGPDPDEWLISALGAAIPGLPLDEIKLPELVGATDMGFLAYRKQMERDEVHDAEIIVFTHAMLGIDFRGRLFAAKKDEEHQELSEIIRSSSDTYWADVKRNREIKGSLSKSSSKDEDDNIRKLERSAEAAASSKLEMSHYENERGRRLMHITEEAGVIPAYRYLMIDECHLFESSLSRVLSDYVPIRSIGRELVEFARHGGKITQSAIKQINRAIKDIVEFGPSEKTESRGEDIVFLNSRGDNTRIIELRSAICTLSNILEGIPKPKSGSDPEAIRIYVALKRDLPAIRAAGNGAHAMLNYSPVRKFPQLTVGKPSMESLLKQLWAFVDGASCVSATIYLPKGDGYTGWYMKSILSIPDSREAEYTPNVGPWAYRPIKEVWMPDAAEAVALVPPSTKDQQAFEQNTQRWHAEIARTIAEKVAPDAAGGILVLTTSYATAQEVGQRLTETLPDTEVIYATQKTPLSAQKAQFLAARKQGKPAIWVATGGAWTGLDINGGELGIAADADNILTDLVITRLPFNTNRSITHQNRKIYSPSINWEIFETGFALRQALGRLVRRVGIPRNRRIWMLDGRITTDAARLSVFQKILSLYKR